DARGGLRPVRREARHRGHGRQDRHDRDRARLHRPARPGRTEPPRAQGGGADAGQGIDQVRDVADDRRAAVMRAIMKTRTLLLALVASAVAPQYASAQLDPLLFLKRGHLPGANTNGQPNVIVMVDTANRMQRDQNNDYRDNNAYPRSGALSE